MSLESIQTRIEQLRAVMPAPAAAPAVSPEADFSQVLSQAVQRQETAADSIAASYTPVMSVADALGSRPGGGSVRVTNVYTGVSDRVRPGSTAGRVSWTGTPDAEITQQAAPYRSIIEDASATFGVPANVIMSVIKCESDYSETETSYSGAMGLMQVMPFNAEDYGITEPYEPRQNIFCGTWEIGELLKMYDGDLKLALTGYNIGCGTLRRLGVTASDSAAYRNNVPEAAQRYTEKVLRLAGMSA